MRTCSKCGGTYTDSFFRCTRNVARYLATKSAKRPICIGCEITARTEKKQRNRPLEKAREAFKGHARKFIEQGKIENRKDLRERFGWDVVQMAHDIEHAFKNGCPYCLTPFKEMPGQLADVSLDMVDPSKPPYYRTNVRWVCRTCNIEKQATSPEHWGEKLQQWAKWRKLSEVRQQDPWAGTLFEGIPSGDESTRGAGGVSGGESRAGAGS